MMRKYRKRLSKEEVLGKLTYRLVIRACKKSLKTLGYVNEAEIEADIGIEDDEFRWGYVKEHLEFLLNEKLIKVSAEYFDGIKKKNGKIASVEDFPGRYLAGHGKPEAGLVSIRAPGGPALFSQDKRYSKGDAEGRLTRWGKKEEIVDSTWHLEKTAREKRPFDFQIRSLTKDKADPSEGNTAA